MYIGVSTRMRGRRRPGFSLVELVVSVAVIAFLLGQVVTVAAGARQKSKAVSCLDKLGRIVRASLAYSSQDATEQSIPIGRHPQGVYSPYTTYYAFGGKAGMGTLRQDPSDSVWGARNGMGTATRPLNAVLYKQTFPEISVWAGPEEVRADARRDLNVYHCPEDQEFPGFHVQGWRDGIHARSSYDYFGLSYMANALWIYNPYDHYWMKSNSPYGRPLSRVPAPSETVFYMENAGRFAMFAYNPDYTNQPMGQCRDLFSEVFVAGGWHGTDWVFNAAFGDGHASDVYIRGYETTVLDERPHGYESLCDCIAVRGDGWRLDTLPSVPVDSRYRGYGGHPISTISSEYPVKKTVVEENENTIVP